MLRTAHLLRPASTPTSRPTSGASLPGTLASPRTGLAPAGYRELVARSPMSLGYSLLPPASELLDAQRDYPAKAHRLSYNRRTASERTFSWFCDPATAGDRRRPPGLVTPVRACAQRAHVRALRRGAQRPDRPRPRGPGSRIGSASGDGPYAARAQATPAPPSRSPRDALRRTAGGRAGPHTRIARGPPAP